MNDALTADLVASERAEIRKLMDDLDALSLETEWDCIGTGGLLWHFGRLIAQEVRTALVVPSRNEEVYPVVLDMFARWAAYHGAEYQDPEEQHVAEAIAVAEQAAIHARDVVRAYEEARWD